MSDEDTSAGDRDASRNEVTERKVKADGSVREFRCEAIHFAVDMAIVRYVVTDPGAFRAPIALEAGVISDGWFWKRRPYSLYRFRTPDGAVIGHRFDAVSDVRLSVDVIEYRDLVLDWWVLPGGRIVEEDREELESLVAAGEVSSAFARRAHDAARTVLGRYRHILDEVQRIERKLGAWAGGPG